MDQQATVTQQQAPIVLPMQEMPQQAPPENVVSQPVAQQESAAAIEYAGFWIRFLASWIDSIIIGVISLLIRYVLQFIIAFSDVGTLFFIMLSLSSGILVGWAYAIFMLNSKEATLGKMALGLKVKMINGEKITLEKAALREILGKFVSVLTLGIGYLMVAFSSKKRGLHDLIAGTVVIKDRK